MYIRDITKRITKCFFSGEVILLIGARQVGKTSLLEQIVNTQEIEDKCLFLNCDYVEDRDLLNQQKLEDIKRIVGEKKYIFIDEGQKAENIGNTLKILVDYFKDNKQVVVTGSSSIHLLDKTSEPLTGRRNTFYLFPISTSELVKHEDLFSFQKKLNEFLIFGTYPKVLNQTSESEKIRQLKELVSSNLYRDILEFQLIRNPSVLTKLLKALALQVGSEVSLREIGNLISLDLRTVERYIDLLEKSFVIFRLPPLYKNKRKEMSKMNKIYFYDTGVRNAILNNFNSAENRNDMGHLFENFIISERLKFRKYNDVFGDQYFWRNYNQQEVDLIEDRDGRLYAYEIKRGKRTPDLPPSFKKDYDVEYSVISPTNMTDFLV